MKTNNVLLKLSGELLSMDDALNSFVQGIKELHATHTVSIVIGGGNILRGGKMPETMSLARTTGDAVGMMATMINGSILQDLLEQAGIATCLLNSFAAEPIAPLFTLNKAQEAHANGKICIFTGGINTPYFTTDTTAVIRALQVGAREVWKLTKVDGIYSGDPAKNPSAELIPNMTHQEALDQNIKIIDTPSLVLAKENNLTLRFFNMSAESPLSRAVLNKTYGSFISSSN